MLAGAGSPFFQELLEGTKDYKMIHNKVTRGASHDVEDNLGTPQEELPEAEVSQALPRGGSAKVLLPVKGRAKRPESKSNASTGTK